MYRKKIVIMSVISAILLLGMVLLYYGTRAKEASYLCEEDDNGVNAEKRAVVKFVNDEKIMNRLDECHADILVEYSCGNNKIESTNINCASSGLKCYAGACQPASKVPKYAR